jgi:triosephosphate isomerase
MKYFIANWKANKSLDEAKAWVEEFLRLGGGSNSRSAIVICPPEPLIFSVGQMLSKSPNLFVGAQNVSSYEEGPHTGEVTAKSLSGIVDLAIVGHSERRSMGETEQNIQMKLEELKKNQIKAILCVRGVEDQIYPDVEFVAYEPVDAIGTGEFKDPTEVLEIRNILKISSSKFLYGGSVDENNAARYLESDKIDGLLVGGASLSASTFYKITNCI